MIIHGTVVGAKNIYYSFAVDVLRIATKDVDRETILKVAMSLGLTDDDIESILSENGQDFNKRIFFLNTLVKWRDTENPELRATFENLISVMKSNGLWTTASILNETLLSDKRKLIVVSLCHALQRSILLPRANKN